MGPKHSEVTMTYKLHDSTIALFAQSLQLALLTGTDIVDHFRTIVLVDDGSGKLVPDPNFEEQFTSNIDRMVQELGKVHDAGGQEEDCDSGN